LEGRNNYCWEPRNDDRSIREIICGINVPDRIESIIATAINTDYQLRTHYMNSLFRGGFVTAPDGSRLYRTLPPGGGRVRQRHRHNQNLSDNITRTQSIADQLSGGLFVAGVVIDIYGGYCHGHDLPIAAAHAAGRTASAAGAAIGTAIAGPVGAIIGGFGGPELYNIALDPRTERQVNANEAIRNFLSNASEEIRNFQHDMNERWQWLRDHPDYIGW